MFEPEPFFLEQIKSNMIQISCTKAKNEVQILGRDKFFCPYIYIMTIAFLFKDNFQGGAALHDSKLFEELFPFNLYPEGFRM